MVMQHTGAATAKAGTVLKSEEGYAILESMRWRTPSHVLDTAIEVIHEAYDVHIDAFDVDLCADAENSAGHYYFSHEMSCLKAQNWRGGIPLEVDSPRPPGQGPCVAWMNPPFGAKGVPKKALKAEGYDPNDYEPFVGIDRFLFEAYYRTMADPELIVVVCAPVSLDASKLVHIRNASIVVPLGRVAFLNEQNEEQTSPPGAHYLLIYSRLPVCQSFANQNSKTILFDRAGR